MTFNELRLIMALQKLGNKISDAMSREELKKYAIKVFECYVELFDDVSFPYSLDEVNRIATNLRKQKDTQTKADVALAHGIRCFWVGRNKGECSDEAECGHLVPACRGGVLSVENCVIECRKHNNERRERTIEEYLDRMEAPHATT